MNKWQKEVHESLLDSEEKALQELEKQYQRSLKDIGDKIKLFQADLDMLDQALDSDLDQATRDLLLSRKRSKIYQKQFQEALKGQISGILDQLHSQNYATIDQYLKQTYEDAYLGTMYDLANQGIPVITPINQAAVTHAVLTDSKVVKGYYDRLGVDIDKLKKVITQEVSRGIATSLPYADIARNINNASRSGLYNAQRIARTEGHRIQNTASRDMANEAVAHGADLVKIWDSTLDGKTRESHRMVDGQIRELDEKFSNGLDRPGDPAGAAEEVINCRCAEIHKPRWALDDGIIKMDNFTGELQTFDNPKDYEDFKEKFWSKENQNYMNYVQDLESKYETKDFPKLLEQMSDQEYKQFHHLEDSNPFILNSLGDYGDKAVPYSQRGIDIGEKLNNALKELKSDGQFTTGNFTIADLAILTTEAGVEFTLVKSNGTTYLIRGTDKSTTIPEEIIDELIKHKGTIEAHSHPFIGDLMPSTADRKIFEMLQWQKDSIIIEPNQDAIVFDVNGVIDRMHISDVRDENYYASIIWD